MPSYRHTEWKNRWRKVSLHVCIVQRWPTYGRRSVNDGLKISGAEWYVWMSIADWPYFSVGTNNTFFVQLTTNTNSITKNTISLSVPLIFIYYYFPYELSLVTHIWAVGSRSHTIACHTVDKHSILAEWLLALLTRFANVGMSAIIAYEISSHPQNAYIFIRSEPSIRLWENITFFYDRRNLK